VRKLLIVFAVILSLCASADDRGLRRIPVVADFADLTERIGVVCNACAALLSPPPPPKSVPLAIVRSIQVKDKPDEGAIEVAYLNPSTDTNGNSYFHASGYFKEDFATRRLTDTDNSPAYTESTLARAMKDPGLADYATIVVPQASTIDTSLLIRHSGPRQFVIEQRTSPTVFAANLGWLRSRPYSTRLSVFDFSPRSRESHATMQVDGTLAEWKEASNQIRKSFDRLGASSANSGPDFTALVTRLKDSVGEVVIIYAHSDGKNILLDTSDGIRKLGASEIEQIGREAGGKLPPVILLNCRADALLADAFLKAGSPFVVATDKALSLDQAVPFLERLAIGVFGEGKDVIDAYFDAQRDVMPFRVRALASDEVGVRDAPSSNKRPILEQIPRS
jgi:hypothetical protein